MIEVIQAASAPQLAAVRALWTTYWNELGFTPCFQGFEQELEDYLSDAAAEETLDAVIDWGRYAEVFAYDDQTEMFSLEDPKG